MTAVLLFMFAIIVIGVGVGVLVAVGLRGMWRDKRPELSDHVSTVARHLSGEAPPPAGFVEAVDRWR